ncbi:MAG: phage protease [Victivallaceae bacterium]|nr:phage protease [Victivallaceae bacterium]
MEGKEREIPEKILLVKFGTNTYTKDGKVSTFDLTNEAADAIIREFTGRARDLVIDFEHATLSGDVARSRHRGALRESKPMRGDHRRARHERRSLLRTVQRAPGG